MNRMRLFTLVSGLFCAVQMSAHAESWFPFTPKNDHGASAIGAEDWLDAPAGKHGILTMKDGDLKFKNGKQIKFWGVNICNQRAGSEKNVSKEWAKKLAKFGVNAVRFHKFTYPNKGGLGSTQDSTKMDPAKMDKFDYFSNELKKRGIYSSWSPIYKYYLTPADKSRVKAYDEIMRFEKSTYGLINFAPDLQQLAIDMMVNLLKHKNPYTKMTYAQDPSLMMIELQNEDDIFFGVTKKAIDNCPTYRVMISEMFYKWAVKKYGSKDKLVAAWGKRAFDKQDDLNKGQLYPICHPWWYSKDGIANQASAGREQRTYDCARFLYETQNDFYDRFAKAIRDTGYKGLIIASCWQAGSNISHYYNLHSDYRIGLIDRHNYFGGKTGHRLRRNGEVNNAAMVSDPGSGLLGTGKQQVVDRPFALSEWISMIPNEWVAEGSPLVAAYGMGLQGWDASFAFASNYAHYTRAVEAPWVYNVDSPTQIGLYPILSRMVYRGDVKEAPVISTRNVHVPDLAKGKVGFDETVKQAGDVKEFSGVVPNSAMAVGRVVIDYVDKPKATKPVSLTRYIDDKNKIITSMTKQLTWNYKDKGFVTIDTPGTQGIVGFPTSAAHKLNDVSLTIKTPFAVCLITAKEKTKTLKTSKTWLISIVGRAKNSGMTYSNDRKRLTNIGRGPIPLEGIQATLSTRRAASRATMYVLDHGGIRTKQTVKPSNGGKGTWELDTNRDKTLYYELVWGK